MEEADGEERRLKKKDIYDLHMNAYVNTLIYRANMKNLQCLSFKSYLNI